MPGKQFRFQKWDMVAIAAVALVAVLVAVLFLPKRHGTKAYAEIYLEGQLVRSVSLEEEQTFAVTGAYSNTISVRDGKIAVVASDCPGEDCVHCGWAGNPGKSIVCLPNGLEIRIVAEQSDVDFVVG